MKKLTIIAATAAGLAISAGTSQAQVLLPGQETGAGGVLPLGTVSGFNTSSALTSIVGAAIQGSQNATLTSWVLQGVNAYGNNDLTFIYQVTENNPLSDVATLGLNGFLVPQVDVGYETSSGVVAPLSAGFTGSTVNFNFGTLGGSASTGLTSELLVVQTSATVYNQNTFTVTDGGASNGAFDLAPVPEANTVVAGALMLLPLGIGAIRAIRKERTV